MRRLRITQQAYLDIDAVADFIRPDNPSRAETFVDEIASKIQTIAERPLSFPDRADWSPGLRSAVHGRYLILFDCDETIVTILRVVHGARDIAKLFEADRD